MDIISSTLPNATESANRLKNVPEMLKEKEQKVKANVDSLKNLINMCKEKVNRLVFII